MVLVDHLDVGGRRFGEPAYDLGGVGGVGDEEYLVVGTDVGDHVVDDTTGLVTAHRVLGVSGTDLGEVGGQTAIDVRDRARPSYDRLAEVAHVEHPDRLAYGLVLGEYSPVGVFQRHVPPSEGGELRAELGVAVVER